MVGAALGCSVAIVSSVGRKWVDVADNVATQIRKELLRSGGSDAGTSLATAERWRVKVADATITYYTRGTLYSTTSPSLDADLERAWALIGSLCSSQFRPTNRAFMIGLDETGKSEPIGHLMLVGALVPREMAEEVERVVGLAQTKKRHRDEYWEGLASELDEFRVRGLDYSVERARPSDIDRYKLNELMDIRYERILRQLLLRTDPRETRVVVDDYGVRDTLRRYLDGLRDGGAEVVVGKRADDSYLETRVASVLAKRERLNELRALNQAREFQIGGLPLGSGSAQRGDTQAWMRGWKESGKPWPWFVRESYGAVRKLDGATAPKKRSPPYR